MLWGDAITPRFFTPVIDTLLAGVGLVLARRNIPNSRAYLGVVLARPARFTEVWSHYRHLITALRKKLRVAAGREDARFRYAPGTQSEEFAALMSSGEPAIFGTFHVGDSDLMGVLIARNFSRRVSMVRLRVGNSGDTERLAARFGTGVEFIWINRPEELLFGLKRALDEGRSIAMQCDREEHATRTAYFRFLGARRRFPVTVYHLAALYARPVAFAFAFPGDDGIIEVHTPPVFRPEPDAPRERVIAAGLAHFQSTLDLLEPLLRLNPYQWFNFTPLNPTEEAPPAT